MLGSGGRIDLVGQLLRHHIAVVLLRHCELLVRIVLSRRNRVHVGQLTLTSWGHLEHLRLAVAVVLVLVRLSLAAVVLRVEQALLLVAGLHSCTKTVRYDEIKIARGVV